MLLISEYKVIIKNIKLNYDRRQKQSLFANDRYRAKLVFRIPKNVLNLRNNANNAKKFIFFFIRLLNRDRFSFF